MIIKLKIHQLYLLRFLPDLSQILQVVEVYPDAPQRFFHASASLALPLVDDSDNTVRQEAAPGRFGGFLLGENHGGKGKPWRKAMEIYDF